MPNPQDMQLVRICSKPETLKRGREIMNLAIIKTRPGSGYDLAMGASGLPPICAYIASQELNNGDITEKIAQSASCLNDKVFARTLNLVRTAISNNNGPDIHVAMTYVTLVRSYTIGMVAKVVGWMEDTEKAIVQQAVLPAAYDVNSPLVKCAIFFWVSKICQIPQVKLVYLLEDYHLPRGLFNSVLKLLSQHCAPIAKSIQAEVAVLRKALREKMFPASPKSTATASTSASASALTLTPATSQKLAQDVPSTSTSTSATNDISIKSSSSRALTQKRSADSEKPPTNESNDVPETPTKKRKLYPLPAKRSTRPLASKAQISAFEAAMSGPSSLDKGLPSVSGIISNPIPSQPGPSTLPRTTRSIIRPMPVETTDPDINMDVDMDLSANRSSSPPPPRRFRPIFLDRKQWSLRDPRVDREWPAMQEHARNMTDLYGLPFAASAPDAEMLMV